MVIECSKINKFSGGSKWVGLRHQVRQLKIMMKKTIKNNKQEGCTRNKDDNILFKILKGCGYFALMYLGMIVLVIFVIGFELVTDEITDIHFVTDKLLPFVIVYGLLAIIVYRIYSTVKYFITSRSGVELTKDKLIKSVTDDLLSPFIRIIYNIYLVTYMLNFVIIMCRKLRFVSVLYCLRPYVRWIILLDIVLVIATIVFCCFFNYVPYMTVQDRGISETERNRKKQTNLNNQNKVMIMQVSIILIFFLCDGVNWDKRLFITCIIADVILTVFEAIRIKTGILDDDKSGKKSPAWVKFLILLTANAMFVFPTIIYTNSNYCVSKVKTFTAYVDSDNYTHHNSTRGGSRYSLTVQDPSTEKKYEFTISSTEYYCEKNVASTEMVNVYKGIWGLEWARRVN